MTTNHWQDVFSYTEGHTARWMRVGPEFFDEVTELIRRAQRSIHFQMYIIEEDATGIRFLNEMMDAAQRGVEVNLVVDGFGSKGLSRVREQELIDAGVHFKRFEPYVSAGRYYIGRRMHHKVMVVDERIGMVGGMNIADRYHGTATEPPWIDYALFIEGPVCKKLIEICRRIITRQFSPAAPNWSRYFSKSATLDPSAAWARARKNDWFRNRKEITLSYNSATRMARESITIVGGYFIPGRKYRRLLSSASRRGVLIRVIMAQKSDVPVVKYASDYLYGWMLRNGIHIYEAKDAMVHGKVAVVDELWSTIGSYNQNQLSAYFSIELNLDIVNREFSQHLHRHLLEVIEKECVEITEDSYYRQASLFAKLRRWLAFQFVRLSLRMMFVVNRVFGVDD